MPERAVLPISDPAQTIGDLYLYVKEKLIASGKAFSSKIFRAMVLYKFAAARENESGTLMEVSPLKSALKNFSLSGNQRCPED